MSWPLALELAEGFTRGFGSFFAGFFAALIAQRIWRRIRLRDRWAMARGRWRRWRARRSGKWVPVGDPLPRHWNCRCVLSPRIRHGED